MNDTESGEVPMNESEMSKEIENLKIAQATQSAAMAGQTATQAATSVGIMTTMAAGFAGLVIGLFLGINIRH
jgi:hypothetical protein